MQIRKANRTDAKTLARLMSDLEQHLTRITNSKLLNTNRPKSSELISSRLRGHKVIYVVEEHKNIIGFLSAHTVDTGSYGVLMIDDMYVRPEFRNRGVGNKLLEAVKKYAKASNIFTVFMLTPRKNISTIKFFKENGFKEAASAHLYLKLK